MAGEWIKIETSLSDKPEVLRISRRLGIDKDCVVGKLARVWGWFDKNSVDGVVDGVVDADIDAIAYQDGFASALVSVGWLLVDSDLCRVSVPNFQRHNGESAKKRALKSERQARWRRSGSEEVDDTASTCASTREEKRREEKKDISKASPSHPAAAGFDEFWTAWPKNERKQDKASCQRHWKLHSLGNVQTLIIDDVRAKRGTKKWQEGFIEAPLVYLRGKRWEDGSAEGVAEELKDWTESATGIIAKGVELGLGEPDPLEQFPVYKRRVFAAAGVTTQ